MFELLEERTVLSGSPPTVVDVQLGGSDWSSDFRDFLDAGSYSMADSVVAGYRMPTGSSAQMSPLPWSNLDQITLKFSEDVIIQSYDLSISGINTTSITTSDFFYDAFNHVAMWTLLEPLETDVYQLDLNGDGLDPVRDLQGGLLDGEWADGQSTVSGNGDAGGDFEFQFRVVVGDDNQNGIVQNDDLFSVYYSVGATTTAGSFSIFSDVDGSGGISMVDVQAIFSHLAETYPSGVPVGVNNDAPSTSGLATVNVDDAATDVAISLFDAFEDDEDADYELAYEITDVSDSSLFDSVYYDSVNGEIVFDAANGAWGRSSVSVDVTDTGGVTTSVTFFVDVDYQNLAPAILDFDVEDLGDGWWSFVGYVSDLDDDVRGMIVQLIGAVSTRVTVEADGTFEIELLLDESVSGSEFAITLDVHGSHSNLIGGGAVGGA